MIKTNVNWTIKNLKNMYDAKETLCFDHPIQRQSSQWTNLQQSLLIHSILANYPVPSIYVEKATAEETDDKGKNVFKYSVLDGKQRLTTIFSYIDNEYALNEDAPNVCVEGEEFELAGKYFDELDEDVKQELLRYRFSILAFEDCSDEEIEEIFFRLNNSTPLTKPQKARPLMGVENSKFINQILTDSFFAEKCNFSALQLRKSDDMCTLLQAMMLLDNKYKEYEYSSISADETMRYAAFIKNNYSYEQQIILTTILDYLNEAFTSKEKLLKKINIPMAVMMADIAITKGIKAYDFHNWFLYFFVARKCEYSQFCSSGSIKKEKVLGRLNTMQDHFMAHFHIEDLEPVKEVIEEPVDEETLIEEEKELETVIENEEVTALDSETSVEEDIQIEENPVDFSEEEIIEDAEEISESISDEIIPDAQEETLIADNLSYVAEE